MDDRKGLAPVLLDVRELSTVTDYFLIVTGSSTPHLKALFNEVQLKLKEAGVHWYRRAGDLEGGWLVIDYVDVIIHIFAEEKRRYYGIEALWAQAPRVPLP